MPNTSSYSNKNIPTRTLGWSAVAGISLLVPPLGSFAASLMSSLESGLIGNPNQKMVYDLHENVRFLNQRLRFIGFENSLLRKEVNSLKTNLLKSIEQQRLMSDLYIASSDPWLRMAINPSNFGLIRLERVNTSTRFEYLDYSLLTDLFIPCPEGNGLLHGGVPIDVIRPMIAKSRVRKLMLYSYNTIELSQPIDII